MMKRGNAKPASCFGSICQKSNHPPSSEENGDESNTELSAAAVCERKMINYKNIALSYTKDLSTSILK